MSKDPVSLCSGTNALRSSITRIASRLCLALGILTATSSIALVVLASSPVPFGDQWFNIVAGRTHDLPWFFALHNEHRLVLPRLAFLLDHDLDAERNGVDLALNLAVLAGTITLVFGFVRRAGLTGDRESLLAWAGLAFGLFSGIQAENLIWGFQIQFFGVCLLAVMAFAVLASRGSEPVTLALTVLLSAAASCTLSAGLLVGIIATGLAVGLGRPRLTVLALALSETMILACYLVGYRSPVQNSSPLEALGHPGDVLRYFAAEIGGPLATLVFASGGLAVGIASAAAVVGLGLLAVRTVQLWRNTPRDPSAGALLATACFCIAFAALTSLGRWGFGPGQALAGRYQTPMLLFWFCFIALWARRSPGAGPAKRAPMVLTLLGVLALIAANQPRYMQFALRVEALETAAIPALLADVADPKALSILSDRPADAVLNEAVALRRAGSSVFTERWAGWLGQPFRDMTVPRNLPRCLGSFDAAAPVGMGERAGWSAAGRLDHTGRFRGRPEIIFVGDDGRVAGFGIAGLSAVAVGEPGPRTAMDGDWWRGAFKATSPTRVTAYVLDRTDHAACTLTYGVSGEPSLFAPE